MPRAMVCYRRVLNLVCDAPLQHVENANCARKHCCGGCPGGGRARDQRSSMEKMVRFVFWYNVTCTTEHRAPDGCDGRQVVKRYVRDEMMSTTQADGG